MRVKDACPGRERIHLLLMVAPGRPKKIPEVEGESSEKKNFHAERKNQSE
jgi:hypothetical protein